jgi:hypothetical protein
MNKIFEPAADPSLETVSSLGERAKQSLITQVREKPAKTFAILLAVPILVSLLLGYRASRIAEESRRQRLMEDWMRETIDWIRQNGRKIAAPIKEGLEATKSAVEEVSHSSARIGRQAQPFFRRQKRSFLNLF